MKKSGSVGSMGKAMAKAGGGFLKKSNPTAFGKKSATKMSMQGKSSKKY